MIQERSRTFFKTHYSSFSFNAIPCSVSWRRCSTPLTSSVNWIISVSSAPLNRAWRRNQFNPSKIPSLRNSNYLTSNTGLMDESYEIEDETHPDGIYVSATTLSLVSFGLGIFTVILLINCSLCIYNCHSMRKRYSKHGYKLRTFETDLDDWIGITSSHIAISIYHLIGSRLSFHLIPY